MKLVNPFIRHRADPFVGLHGGRYYFTASVPEYDRIILRRSHALEGLATAQELVVWHAPASGPASALIWAPEIHRFDDAWYIYFAAAPSREIKSGLFQHRMYALRNPAADPAAGAWQFAGQIDSGIDAFCLDATSFRHRGRAYYVWAQKHPDIPGNSNLYIAPLATPTRLADAPVLLSKPEFDWEVQGFAVNEGPAVLIRHGKVFIAYSASATDERYAMGLLWADAGADLLDARQWHKSPTPIFTTDVEYEIFGPGHNSFTTSADGQADLMIYHARDYRDIEGDPLWNADRHARVHPLSWDAHGMPVFGRPQREVIWPAEITA